MPKSIAATNRRSFTADAAIIDLAMAENSQTAKNERRVDMQQVLT